MKLVVLHKYINCIVDKLLAVSPEASAKSKFLMIGLA